MLWPHVFFLFIIMFQGFPTTMYKIKSELPRKSCRFGCSVLLNVEKLFRKLWWNRFVFNRTRNTLSYRLILIRNLVFQASCWNALRHDGIRMYFDFVLDDTKSTKIAVFTCRHSSRKPCRLLLQFLFLLHLVYHSLLWSLYSVITATDTTAVTLLSRNIIRINAIYWTGQLNPTNEYSSLVRSTRHNRIKKNHSNRNKTRIK
jgi:hypothetical protein